MGRAINCQLVNTKFLTPLQILRNTERTRFTFVVNLVTLHGINGPFIFLYKSVAIVHGEK